MSSQMMPQLMSPAAGAVKTCSQVQLAESAEENNDLAYRQNVYRYYGMLVQMCCEQQGSTRIASYLGHDPIVFVKHFLNGVLWSLGSA